jgi:formate dehydrogenase iron-sulfur subunit
MTEGSLCAMGGLTPMPVRSAITHFPDDFLAREPISPRMQLPISVKTEGRP